MEKIKPQYQDFTYAPLCIKTGYLKAKSTKMAKHHHALVDMRKNRPHKENIYERVEAFQDATALYLFPL